MEISNVFALAGGLALFLYGMTMMSNGLELAAGNKMKAILEKLTTNRFLGVAVGALITALIQSSSATTVMVVGFVNAGLMNLQNAVWVIMGANIGTTITGQLIALDITAIAPLIAFVGVALVVFFKSKKLDAFGQILGGLGILFIGMSMMSDAMSPLRNSPEFASIVANFENPLIGVLVGAIFTAIIQSSSASVGILQALAMSGVVTLPTAIYVLFGQNIGTCITAALASIGTNRNAKRTTIIHLSFNIIGTVFFVIVSMLIPFASFVESLTPTNVAAQIANVHTIFNVVTTILLLPFGHLLVKFTYIVLPDKKDSQDSMEIKYLDRRIFENDFHIGTSAIAGTQLFNETQNMLAVATKNIKRAFGLVEDYQENIYEKIVKDEEYINFLNKQIVDYTTLALSYELPIEGAQSIGLFLRISADLEKIGDHALNIANRAHLLHEENHTFSKEALDEIETMNHLVGDVLYELKVSSPEEFNQAVIEINQLKNKIDKTSVVFTSAQLDRLKNKTCSTENSVLYTKVLTDFERIGVHADHIAKYYQKLETVLSALKMQQS